MKRAVNSLKIMIVRHAESDFNKLNRIQGHLDSKLTERGSCQAQLLAKELQPLHIRKIYSSNLGRALSTTRYLSKKLKKPITLEPGLKEIHLGKWEGLTPDEVNARYQNGYDRWRSCPSKMRIPGSEGVAAFRKRTLATFERIMRKEKSGCILIVTHGGVIASLLAHWLKADFDNVLLNLKLDNTSVTYVEERGGRVILHAINDTSHLERKGAQGACVFTQHH